VKHVPESAQTNALIFYNRTARIQIENDDQKQKRVYRFRILNLAFIKKQYESE